MPRAGLTEFYTIRPRAPITDDQLQITMMIEPDTDAPQGKEDVTSRPASMVSSVASPVDRMSMASEAVQHVFIYPQKLVFSKRRQEAHVSIQIQNETGSQRLNDRQFRLTHITQSRNYDYHKLQMTLNIYRLGTSFSEVVSSGRDDMLQLGHEESYSKFKDEMGLLGE